MCVCVCVFPRARPACAQTLWTASNRAVCLFVCLFVCRLPACLPACLPPCLACCLSACLSFCLSVFLSFCLSVFLPFCLSACLPMCLCVCVSLCLCVCVSMCLCACWHCLPQSQHVREHPPPINPHEVAWELTVVSGAASTNKDHATLFGAKHKRGLVQGNHFCIEHLARPRSKNSRNSGLPRTSRVTGSRPVMLVSFLDGRTWTDLWAQASTAPGTCRDRDGRDEIILGEC